MASPLQGDNTVGSSPTVPTNTNMDKQAQEDLITSAKGTLWGTAGGQLELMSMSFITRKVDGRWQKFAILRFTDHDLQAVGEDGLRDAGLNPWYELTFPITDDN